MVFLIFFVIPDQTRPSLRIQHPPSTYAKVGGSRCADPAWNTLGRGTEDRLIPLLEQRTTSPNRETHWRCPPSPNWKQVLFQHLLLGLTWVCLHPGKLHKIPSPTVTHRPTAMIPCRTSGGSACRSSRSWGPHRIRTCGVHRISAPPDLRMPIRVIVCASPVPCPT